MYETILFIAHWATLNWMTYSVNCVSSYIILFHCLSLCVVYCVLCVVYRFGGSPIGWWVMVSPLRYSRHRYALNRGREGLRCTVVWCGVYCLSSFIVLSFFPFSVNFSLALFFPSSLSSSTYSSSHSSWYLLCSIFYHY